MENIERYTNVLAVSLYNRSRAWGADYFLRKPADLDQKLDNLWTLLTGNSKFLGNLSDAEEQEYSESLRDAFGIEYRPDMILDVIPRIMLRTGRDTPEPILSITQSKTFLRYSGSRTTGDFTNKTASEVTFEDILWYLKNFPSDKLDVLALNLELHPKHKAELQKMVLPIIMEATEKQFENAVEYWPGWKILSDMDVSGSERMRWASIFELLNPTVTAKSWDEYRNRPTPSFLSNCAIKMKDEWGEAMKKGHTYIHTGKAESNSFFGQKGWQIQDVPVEPSMFEKPTEAEVKKALKAIPIEYKIMAIPFETVEEWLKDEVYNDIPLLG